MDQRASIVTVLALPAEKVVSVTLSVRVSSGGPG